MGYHSEAALALYEDEYKEMLIKAARVEEMRVLEFISTSCDRFSAEAEGEPAVILHWDYVKWYSEIPSVRFVEEWMADDSHRYAFIRLGEDDGDTEVSSTDEFLEDCLGIRREICFDCDEVYEDDGVYPANDQEPGIEPVTDSFFDSLFGVPVPEEGDVKDSGTEGGKF